MTPTHWRPGSTRAAWKRAPDDRDHEVGKAVIAACVVRLSDVLWTQGVKHVYRGAVVPPNDVLRPLVEDWRWPGPDYR